MTPKIEYHRSLESELDAIAGIEHACFGTPWTRGQLAESLASDIVVMETVCAEGVPAGYLCATIIVGEAEIQRIAVLPEYRRQRLAYTLLESFFAAYRPSETFLDVRASNFPAQKLYEKEGFAVCGVRKRYYENPAEDAVLMKRSMSL